MAEIIKKAKIFKEFLPPVDSESFGYVVRYRIISEDKNRTSHWSPTFVTNAVTVESVEGAVSTTASIITVVWGDELDMPSYDVFVKFNTDPDFVYHGTSNVHNYQFLKEAGTSITSVEIIIQVEGINKEYNAVLVIYDSGVISLV
jgi:hypothetical protein